MSLLSDEVRVIDADAHMTEARDLWVKRAPAAYKDRVPRVEKVDGRSTWIVDGDTSLGFAGGGSVIDLEGDLGRRFVIRLFWAGVEGDADRFSVEEGKCR